MAGEQTIANDGRQAEKLGNVAGKLGKTVGKMGRDAEKLGKMVGKLGTAIRKMGTVAFALGNVAGKMGMVVGKLGTAGGELGTVLRNWGSRPEKCAGHGNRSVWAIKFLRSGCEPFARWLSIRLPTVPRMLMACPMTLEIRQRASSRIFNFRGATWHRETVVWKLARHITAGSASQNQIHPDRTAEIHPRLPSSLRDEIVFAQSIQPLRSRLISVAALRHLSEDFTAHPLSATGKFLQAGRKCHLICAIPRACRRRSAFRRG